MLPIELQNEINNFVPEQIGEEFDDFVEAENETNDIKVSERENAPGENQDEEEEDMFNDFEEPVQEESNVENEQLDDEAQVEVPTAHESKEAPDDDVFDNFQEPKQNSEVQHPQVLEQIKSENNSEEGNDLFDDFQEPEQIIEEEKPDPTEQIQNTNIKETTAANGEADHLFDDFQEPELTPEQIEEPKQNQVVEPETETDDLFDDFQEPEETPQSKVAESNPQEADDLFDNFQEPVTNPTQNQVVEEDSSSEEDESNPLFTLVDSGIDLIDSMLEDIQPKLIEEETALRSKKTSSVSQSTTIRKEPKFVEYLTKLNLSPQIFVNIQKLDNLAQRGQVESIDSQLIGHFQFFRKALLKIFIDSHAFQMIELYLGERINSNKVKRSINNLNKNFNFEQALVDFERVLDSASYDEAQKFLNSLPDFSDVFLV